MDIVVLTVIQPELEASRLVLGIEDRDRERGRDGTVYFRGEVRSTLAGRDYRLVLACIGAAGNAGAAATTALAIATYRPRAVLLMGIAAGVRDKVRIGEVVLSDRVIAYEPAALLRSANGATVQPRPEIDRTPYSMLQDVVSYRPEPSRLREAFDRAGGVVPEPSLGRDDEFRVHVATAITARMGTIASGEKLLRDPEKLLAVRQLHGKVEVGEMEAAGLIDSCRRWDLPWLVIRGISDFGDELKDDRFHGFASCAAAAVTFDFIAYGLDLGVSAGGRATAGPSRTSVGDLLGERSMGTGVLAAAGSTEAHIADGLRRATPNPFVFGRAIDRDEDMVGRDDERRWLREAIAKRQPVQLLGERLMGKTTLLRWVERTAFLDRPVIWFDPSRGVTPASMVQSIARALGKLDTAARLERADTTADQAGQVLDALVPFVLLVDDADALCSRGSGFDDGFFEAVRTLVQDGKLTWVSASRRNLYELFHARGLTSRFLNDAKKVWIGPLAAGAADELAGRTSSAELAARILRTAGRFAYGLQWLGDFVHRRPDEIDQACDAYADDMAPTFHGWWGGVEVQDRQLIKRCLAGAAAVAELDDRSRRRLRGLKDRGLVTERGGRIFVEGESWRGFVADAS